MKKIVTIRGVVRLSKAEQKAIQGGLGIIRPQNCPGVGGAMCPDGCYCNLATGTCAFINGGGYCTAL